MRKLRLIKRIHRSEAEDERLDEECINCVKMHQVTEALSIQQGERGVGDGAS